MEENEKLNDDGEVVEVENPNPVVHETTIELSSGFEIEPKANNEVNRVSQQDDEVIDKYSDREDNMDDPNDQEFTPGQLQRKR